MKLMSEALFSEEALRREYSRCAALVDRGNVPTYAWDEATQPVLSIIGMANRDTEELEKESTAILLEARNMDNPDAPPALVLVPLDILRKFILQAETTLKATGLV